MMSARPASSPGSSARASGVGAAMSSATRSSSCAAVRVRLLTDRGRVPVARIAAISASVAMVPDEPDRHLHVQPRGPPDANGAIVERTWRRQASTAPGCVCRPSKKRRVRRIAPSFSERDASTSPRRPTSSSVLPPPMSQSRRRRSYTGTAWSTPRWMRRASSTPEITLTWTRASSHARSISTSRFSASRTADVATAVIGASWTSATCRNRSSASTARSMASAVSSRMSPALDPSRTISFSRSRISKRGPASPVGHPGDHAVQRVRADVDGGERLGASARMEWPRAQSGRDARWCRVVSLAMPTKPPPKRKVKGGRVTAQGRSPRPPPVRTPRVATRRRCPRSTRSARGGSRS